MKLTLAALLVALCLAVPNAHACSEAGPHEFDLNPGLQERCAKYAQSYVQAMAGQMLKLDVKEWKGNERPNGKFTLEKTAPTLYFTAKKYGTQRFGFNITATSTNGWECTYCVNFALHDGAACTLDSVSLHMCAK